MFKILSKLLLLTIAWLQIANSNNLVFRIDVTKDTILLGEPLMIKCILLNKGHQEKKIWYGSVGGLLSSGCLGFNLYVPNKDYEYKYDVYMHVISGGSPGFHLPPQDSIYFYTLLSWTGNMSGFFCPAESGNGQLVYDELEKGYYRIKSKYFLPGIQLTSNVDSFIGEIMPHNEKQLYEQAGDLINSYIGHPYNIEQEGYDEINEKFPNYIQQTDLVMGQYCHYILAFCSPSSTRIGYCESFLKKYPNTPLSEPIAFWNARAHSGIGQENRSKELLWRAQTKYPDNIMGFQYRNKKQKEPIPVSIGLTVRSNTALRIEPDSISEIVKLIEFGEPFLIFEKKPFREGNREWHWYRVMLRDKVTKGWIISKEGREGNLKVVDLENDDYAGLYYAVANSEAWGYHEHEVAETLFKYILNTYSDRKIPIIEPILGDVEYHHANMAALERLAMLHYQKKEFTEAIQYHKQRLTQKEATGEDTISTKFGMMRVYLAAIEVNEKIDEALNYYHHIIKDFMDAKLVGYEGHVWLDIETTEYIVRIFSAIAKDTNRLYEECKKIMEETSNPAVYLIAAKGVVISQLRDNNTQLARATIMNALDKYPEEIRYYWKGRPENYSIGLIKESIYNAVRFFGNSKNFESFVSSLSSDLKDYNIDLDQQQFVFTIKYSGEKEAKKYKYLHILHEKQE